MADKDRDAAIRGMFGIPPKATAPAAPRFSSAIQGVTALLEQFLKPGARVDDLPAIEQAMARHAALLRVSGNGMGTDACHLLSTVVLFAVTEGLDLDRIVKIAKRVSPDLLQADRDANPHSVGPEAKHIGMMDFDIVQDHRSMGSVNLMLAVKSYCQSADIDFADTLDNVMDGRLEPAEAHMGPRSNFGPR